MKLSVVIPAFNASGWITRCLDHLRAALLAAEVSDCEVLVIDDGSTDTTAAEARSVQGIPVKVISTPNQGRFRAREVGASEATGTHILFLDSRVFLGHDSLKFVLPYLSDPSTSLWTAHVEAETRHNAIARFWRCIETVFWRRYFRNPRMTSFGHDEFDYYPKGTTALIGPSDLLRRAIAAFEPTVADWRKVNDDTALLRYALNESEIHISPGYSCTYNARTSFKAFLKHANHRGAVLIDGFLRPGTRLNIPIRLVLATAPLALLAAVILWEWALLLLVVVPLLIGLLCRALGARTRDVAVLAVLFWPFAAYYLAGMYWGLFLRLRGRPINPV